MTPLAVVLLDNGLSWVSAGASLDLDFASGRAFAGGVTNFSSVLSCSRASTKYAQTSAGLLVPFAANMPAITDLGLLVEETDTNGIRNPRAEGGTSSASPTNWTTNAVSSLTITPVGVSQINGIDGMAYDIAGTASGTTASAVFFEGATQIVAAATDVWSLSPYIAILSGTTAGLSKIANRALWAGAGTNVDGVDIKATLTATPQRFTTTLTAPASTTFIRPQVSITPINTGVVSLRLWVGWPQAVKAPYATSPIVPVVGSPAATTRAADVISLTGAGATAALNAASAYFMTTSVAGGTDPRLIDFAGTQAAYFSSTTVVRATNGTNNADATIGGAGTYTGSVRSALGFDTTSITSIANGGTQATSANSWGSPSGTVYIGNRAAGDRALNGFMSRLTMSAAKGKYDGSTA